ncbi:MAG: hypothetical protein EBZ77_16400 [Chitinophagia bacterium]|nr:hypothetical protein [Chitinophagia bacterium]
MLRRFSLLIRQLQGIKETRRTLAKMDQWRNEVSKLARAPKVAGNTFIIRLDDIGDYLLFRNSLATLRSSERYNKHKLTLLGNVAWKPLFEALDSHTVNEVIWLDKRQYFDNADYRQQIWHQMAQLGCTRVLCPSRSRSLLLDDLCMLAAGAQESLAAANTLVVGQMNTLSNSLYSSLYKDGQLLFEFHYNQAWLNWACGGGVQILPCPSVQATPLPEYESVLLCFIGGSKRSHLWPEEHWCTLIGTLKKEYNIRVVIAGGKGDAERATAIAAVTGAENIAGQYGLVEMMRIFAGARLVISHDTMAAHLAASLQRPTVILANGDNFYRFCAYEQAGITGVKAVYARHFMQTWKQRGYQPFIGYKAVTRDIATITPTAVFTVVSGLLH